jgi:hypothetical protein
MNEATVAIRRSSAMRHDVARVRFHISLDFRKTQKKRSPANVVSSNGATICDITSHCGTARICYRRPRFIADVGNDEFESLSTGGRE